MSDGLHLSPRHRAKIEELLREHLPDVEVWAYGSRVTGESHDGSDLDLVLRGPNCEEVDIGRLGDFTEGVELSTIPFIVEARDWARLPESFRESILQGYTVLVEADSHSPSRSSPALAEDRHKTVSQPLADAISRTRSRLRIGEWAPFSYGKALPKQKRTATGNVRVYGSSGVVGHHDTALTNGPTIIIGRKGTVGAVHYSPDPCWPIDTTFFIEGDDHVLHRFKYYALKAADLHNMNADSAVPGLNRNEAHAELIYVPPLTEQRSISRLLGALDDKIELNRRMSETLEEMARALFKSWFVDFEPVHAKSERRPTGLPNDLDTLFPDSFELSELGDIPTGWQVRSLSSIASFVNGLALQRYPPLNEAWLPVIKIPEMRRGYTERPAKASADIDPRFVVEDGDVIFSWSGSLEVVLWGHGRGALNQHLFKVTSQTFPKWFYWHWICQHLDSFRGIAAGKATTMGHIQRHHLAEAKVVVPPDHILLSNDLPLRHMTERLVRHAVESRTLASVRDTLLPKLLSGDLRVRRTADTPAPA